MMWVSCCMCRWEGAVPIWQRSDGITKGDDWCTRGGSVNEGLCSSSLGTSCWQPGLQLCCLGRRRSVWWLPWSRGSTAQRRWTWRLPLFRRGSRTACEDATSRCRIGLGGAGVYLQFDEWPRGPIWWRGGTVLRQVGEPTARGGPGGLVSERSSDEIAQRWRRL